MSVRNCVLRVMKCHTIFDQLNLRKDFSKFQNCPKFVHVFVFCKIRVKVAYHSSTKIWSPSHSDQVTFWSIWSVKEVVKYFGWWSEIENVLWSIWNCSLILFNNFKILTKMICFKGDKTGMLSLKSSTSGIHYVYKRSTGVVFGIWTKWIKIGGKPAW